MGWGRALVALVLVGCGGTLMPMNGNDAGLDTSTSTDSTTSNDVVVEAAGDACGPTIRMDCNNGKDDDNDGLIDSDDPECLGPFDNDEASFSFGIPNGNCSPCTRDCAFDSNSGQGDDKCTWDVRCDPKKPHMDCQSDAGSCPSQTAWCRQMCLPLVPNGCDCFGCCAVDANTFVYAVTSCGEPFCSQAKLGDTKLCAPCTPNMECFNACDTCELCFNKQTLPAQCGGKPVCDNGRAWCDATHRCPCGQYCVTGCCVSPPM